MKSKIFLTLLLGALSLAAFGQGQQMTFSPTGLDKTGSFAGAITVGGTSTLTGALTCAGLSNLDGGIAVLTNKFTVSTAGAVAAASTVTASGSTSGSIGFAPIAVGTNATTLANQAGGSAKVITMPPATATLATLGLDETISGTKTFSVGSPVISVPTTFEALLSTTATVTLGTNTTETSLYTVPAGKSCVITRVVIRAASGDFDQATDEQFSFGFNAASRTNVIANATYTKPSASTTAIVLVPDGKTSSTESTIGTAGGTFGVLCNATATAGRTATIDVFGYLF